MMREAPRDEARREIAARGLTPAAVAHLTRDALGTIDFAALAPVKKLLKQFFSAQPWTDGDDDALAALVGPGDGWSRHQLNEDIALEFGWRAGAFRMEATPLPAPGGTFGGPVTPEATPNPRTTRFVTPPIHDGPSRWYESVEGVDDPRVARLFADFDDVANVLVGPTFVAIGLRNPDQWEQLLDPILHAVTIEFASRDESLDAIGAEAGRGDSPVHSRSESAHDGGSALERAWKELGALRSDEPTDLERIIEAVSSSESSARQVAARLLIGAAGNIAEREWTRLLGDSSRSVRRATVDAMVDAERPALRPLLETALNDADAWTRWKALHGLAELGAEASRTAITPLTEDPDFRVRLEAAGALRDP